MCTIFELVLRIILFLPKSRVDPILTSAQDYLHCPKTRFNLIDVGAVLIDRINVQVL